MEIGENYEGCIVFYTWDEGTHGLIAHPTDAIFPHKKWEWGCYGVFISASGTSIGDGKLNTTLMYDNCGESSAAYYCSGLTTDGYTDWFLPSKDELEQLYLQNEIVGGFRNGNYYWSSSEDNENNAWLHYFTTDTVLDKQRSLGKNGSCYIRAIRQF